MIVAAEEKCSGDDSERAGPAVESGTGHKRPEIGYRFMPSASKRKLTRACAKEKNKLAKLRLLTCIWRKEGHNIRRIGKDWPCHTRRCGTGWCGCRSGG